MDRTWKFLCAVEGLAILALVVVLANRPSEPPPPTVPLGLAEDARDADATKLTAATSEMAGEVQAVERSPERAPVSTPAPADPQLATTLHGRIVDPDGNPVSDANVYLRRSGEARGISAGVHDGYGYAVVGLGPGAWSVTCRAKGFVQQVVEVEVAGEAVLRRDLVLEPAWVLAVALVDEGGGPAPVAWAEEKLFVGFQVAVVATLEQPPESFPMTSMSSVAHLGIGKWRSRMHRSDLPERFFGQLEIDASAPVWVAVVLRQTVLAMAQVEPGQSEVELAVPVETLRRHLAAVHVAVVASESGQPLAGARVAISDRQTGNTGRPTDASGRLTTADVVPGIVELTVRGEDRELYWRALRVHPGEDLDLGVIRLDPMRSIKGTVRDMDGEPVAGASFSWHRIDRLTAEVPMDNGRGASSDTEGAFELWGSGAGRYLVQARHKAGIAAQVVDTSAGDVEDLQVRLEPRAGVTLVNRVPADKIYLVRITDSTGMPVLAWLERPMATQPERPISLLPGRYTVEIREEERIVRTVELDARKPGARLVVP